MHPATERIRSQITTAYTMLVFDFADPEGINKAEIESYARCPLLELFDKQKSADRVKKHMKADFPKALSVYFNQFQSRSGFDCEKLKLKLDGSEKVFLRHLGKDKVLYLKLLIFIAEALAEKPKGLLFGVAG